MREETSNRSSASSTRNRLGNARTHPDPDFNKGHEAVAGLWASWADTFDDFWARPGPQLVAGGDKVIVEHRTGGRLRGSARDAPEVRYDNWTVYTVQERLAVAVKEYSTLPEALAAAGIAKPTVYTLRDTEIVGVKECPTPSATLDAVSASA
jgi:hypothetical protein